ncbi:MAG: YIP1 family protein [Candidatus Aminicenantes bacterium]|nr:YIP1 family protein [Candidatus Aminicenantes bacterium]
MNLIQRAQGILTAPAKEWATIKTEKTPVQTLFLSYAVPLAAITAVAQFIGLGLFSRWWGVGRGLGYAVLYYVLGLAMVFGVGFVINALAPNFGSKQSLENAMALAVYSMTPSWVVGALYLIPAWYIMVWLVWLASLYGLYILYLGFTAPLMDTPKDKQLSYFIISLIVAIVGIALIQVIVRSIFIPRIARFVIP